MSKALAHSQTDNPISDSQREHPVSGERGGSLSDAGSQSPQARFNAVMNKPLPTGARMGHFSRREKIGRLLWVIVQGTVFRFSPRRADNWRAWLLRRFGARVGRVKLLRSTVRVEVPWNIEIGEGAQIGDRVYLYSLGPIRIGAHSVISQFCHLCAGTHDFERSDFPLLRMPITIGEHCWIATESYISPGVTIGDGVVVGARGAVIQDLPEWTICVGSPAKPVRARTLFDVKSGDLLSPS